MGEWHCIGHECCFSFKVTTITSLWIHRSALAFWQLVGLMVALSRMWFHFHHCDMTITICGDVKIYLWISKYIYLVYCVTVVSLCIFRSGECLCCSLSNARRRVAWGNPLLLGIIGGQLWLYAASKDAVRFQTWLSRAFRYITWRIYNIMSHWTWDEKNLQRYLRNHWISKIVDARSMMCWNLVMLAGRRRKWMEFLVRTGSVARIVRV